MVNKESTCQSGKIATLYVQVKSASTLQPLKSNRCWLEISSFQLFFKSGHPSVHVVFTQFLWGD